MKLISSASRWACFATVLAILLGSAHPASAGKGKFLVLHVRLDLLSLNLVESPVLGEGAFYVAGDLLRPGTGTKVGAFRCWGFLINGGEQAAMSQEYDLGRRGKIEVQGVGGDGPQAITGGTRKFRNVSGDVSGFNPCIVPDPSVIDPLVTVRFRLIGAGSGKKQKKEKESTDK